MDFLMTVLTTLGSMAEYWFPLALFVLYASMMAGWLGGGMGVPDLFREDEELITKKFGTYLNSPVVWSCFCITLLSFCYWAQAVVFDELTAVHIEHFANKEDTAVINKSLDFPSALSAIEYIVPRALVFVALAVAVALPSITRDNRPDEGKVDARQLRAGLGVLLGLLLIAAMCGIAVWIDLHMADIPLYFWPTFLLGLPLVVVIAFLWLTNPIPALTIGLLFLGAFMINGALMLLKFIGGDYGIALRFHVTPLLSAALILFLFALVWLVNGNRFKYRFPGIGCYDAPVRLSASVAPAPKTDQPATGARAALIDPLAGLEHWKARQTPADAASGKPDLIVVTTSGGAYRAAYWTAIVLDRLWRESRPDGRLPGVVDKIRFVTGASGGMVGAAYFAAMRADGAAGPATAPESSVEAVLNGDTKAARTVGCRPVAPDPRTPWATRPTQYAIHRDSLTPVAQQLVQGDLFHLLTPFRQDIDRGVVLESQWLTLDRPVAALRDGEAAGRVPSLIFSPMLVETGQPLLISNLDLTAVRHSSANDVVEFFALFPDAHETFRLRTAVRMNATFPYMSPAVSLPTEPPRRVVDAGFYDNYGINIATAVLSTPAVTAWIKEHVRRIVFVQLNAFAGTSVADRAARASAEAMMPESSGSRLARAFHWLTTPLEGAGAARKAAMVFRNEQEFRMLQAIYGPDRVHTVAFENVAETSMSWYVPADQLRAMYDENEERLQTGIQRLQAILG